MEVKTINYYGSDGWESCTDYNYTPSSQLHIPRVGDKIENSYGNTYKVENVYWKLGSNTIVIICELNG